MITWILGSYLVSIVGWMAYRSFGLRLDARGRRVALIAVCISALLMPALVLASLDGTAREARLTSAFKQQEAQSTAQVTDPEVASQLVTDPGDGSLRINEHEVALFESRPVLDWFVENKSSIQFGLLSLSGLILGLLALRLFSLARLIRSSYHRREIVDGCDTTLLYTRKKQAIGSFRLFGKWIIWHEDYDELKEEDRRSILVHEAAHLRQRHTWDLLALQALRAIWFLNPVWHLIQRELRKTHEFLADNLVIDYTGDRAAYAQLLLAQSQGIPTRSGLIHGSHGFTDHPLSVRIREVLQPTIRKSGLRNIFQFVGLALLLGLGTSVLSMPEFQAGEEAFEVYEIQYCINQSTGQIIFCGDCFTEGLDCACIAE